jgi:hypothetical protein
MALETPTNPMVQTSASGHVEKYSIAVRSTSTIEDYSIFEFDVVIN